jgi:hypothetical protein
MDRRFDKDVRSTGSSREVAECTKTSLKHAFLSLPGLE